jgi:hypothetical protein
VKYRWFAGPDQSQINMRRESLGLSLYRATALSSYGQVVLTSKGLVPILDLPEKGFLSKDCGDLHIRWIE